MYIYNAGKESVIPLENAEINPYLLLIIPIISIKDMFCVLFSRISLHKKENLERPFILAWKKLLGTCKIGWNNFPQPLWNLRFLKSQNFTLFVLRFMSIIWTVNCHISVYKNKNLNINYSNSKVFQVWENLYWVWVQHTGVFTPL